MIDIIKRLLGGAPEDRKAVDSSRGHDLKVATCALLVEMGRIDETFTKREIDTIIEILESRYGLSSEDAEALMAEADKALEESVDLWQFARLINENYSRQEKIGIIETLWQVVFVDGKMDQYEDYLMHKLATLLRLHHKELMDAKLKILHGPASHPSQGPS
jgi:uncharacterized tellurite resistance protein B-like protein